MKYLLEICILSTLFSLWYDRVVGLQLTLFDTLHPAESVSPRRMSAAIYFSVLLNMIELVGGARTDFTGHFLHIGGARVLSVPERCAAGKD